MNRKLTLLLILYAAGVLCGILLLLRQPARPKKDALSPGGLFSRGTVAVVEIYGPIYFSQSSSSLGFLRNADRIVRKLRKINESGDIKAVVLKINSPGGSVGASQEIAREVRRLRESKKIVVASMGDVAASGGYYIASQADRIVANPGSITGSIGVIFQAASAQELLRKVGVRVETVKSGRHKDIGSPFRELSAEERAMLQNIIDDAYQQFVAVIVESRSMDRGKVLALADGRIMTGSMAKKAGLVDELGSSAEAIALAANLAGLGEKPQVMYDVDGGSLGQLLGLFGESMRPAIIPHRLLSEHRIRLDYILE